MLNFTKSDLTVVSVAFNKITSSSILSSRLSGCDALEKLILNDNALTGVLDLPLLPELIDLKASKNRLTSLKQGLLGGLPKLAILDLENNGISVLDFDIPGTVGTLTLKDNVIEKISAGLFENLNTWPALDLSKNRIKEIEEGAFEGMNSLTRLNLADNQLSNIPHMADITDTLLELNLDKNSFNISALWNLVQFHYLEVLSLSSCGLNGSLRLPPLPNLTELILSGNYLTDIDTGDLLKFTNLQVLNLNVNDLKTLHVPTEFPMSLHKLFLGENEFENISADAFASHASPSELSELQLSRNNIRDVDEGAFNGLSLKILYIVRNSLTTIPNLTPCRNTLKELFISYNPLKVINKTRLSGFNRLKTLVATQTQLSGTLDLPTLPALKTLGLNKNAFSDISTDLFHGFHALESVYLQYNNFKSLPNVARPPIENDRVAIPGKVSFNFKNNKLGTLKEDWFLYMSESSQFDVSFNDIVCDSGLCWMSDCGRRRRFPYELLMPNCRGDAWRGVPWKNVDIQQLCPGKRNVFRRFPANTWHNNNVIITSKRRRDVVLT